MEPSKRVALVVLLAAVLATGFFVLGNRKPAQKPAPVNDSRQVAPDFSLPDLTGQNQTLSQYKGKLVILDFWATWCAPCRTEIPQFVAWQDKYRVQGLQVIGISMDDGPKAVQTFQQQVKMNYPVLMGNEKVAEAYGGVLGLPITYVIGRDGRIFSRREGETDMAALEKEVAKHLAD